MAPIKFDNHIREQLQEREIQPSKDACKKLQAQLNQAPKKKNFTKWYAIAASVVGFVIFVSIVFNKTSEKTVNPLIVEVNSNKEQKNPVQTEVVSETKTSSTPQVISKQERQLVQENTLNKLDKVEKDIQVISEKKPNEVEIKIVLETEITSVKVSTEEDFEKAKIAEVVAQVNQLQSKNNTVSSYEIEALLAKAQQEITFRKLVSNSNKKVDATALLNSVEEELETSFREKVFEALGDQYKKVRTAVVNRDN